MVTEVSLVLSRAVGAPVGRRSGGRLATTLVATINVIIHFFPPFFHFFCLCRSLGVHTFPELVDHFGAP